MRAGVDALLFEVLVWMGCGCHFRFKPMLSDLFIPHDVVVERSTVFPRKVIGMHVQRLGASVEKLWGHLSVVYPVSNLTAAPFGLLCESVHAYATLIAYPSEPVLVYRLLALYPVCHRSLQVRGLSQNVPLFNPR